MEPLRIFQGETLPVGASAETRAGSKSLILRSGNDLIYFGYGGQNAGFDAYERVGVLQATQGCALTINSSPI